MKAGGVNWGHPHHTSHLQSTVVETHTNPRQRHLGETCDGVRSVDATLSPYARSWNVMKHEKTIPSRIRELTGRQTNFVFLTSARITFTI